MSDWYNFENVTNSTNLHEVVIASNQIVNGWWGLGLLFGFFIVSFLAMKGYPTRSSLPASIFLTTLLAMVLRTAGLITHDTIVFGFIVSSVITIIILIYTK